MAVNLLRNARVFYTQNVNSTTGELVTSGHNATVTNAAFTQELQVLDGFTFSQNTTAETITLNESGATPNRGSRNFNTSLDPVEWSFSTYIRPRYVDPTTPAGTIDAGDLVRCEERVLWNAMLSSNIIGNAGAAYSEDTTASTETPFALITTANSEVNQLLKFGLIVMFDDQTWYINDCAIESATVDFGIDQIGTIQWSGRGVTLKRLATNGTATAGTFGGGLAGSYNQKDTDAKYITNKLSAARLVSANNKFGLGGTKTYNLAITGGNFTITNNLTYLTPANIGVLNTPCAYFTGARSISGSLTAYLRADTDNTADLMNQVITAGNTSPENMFDITIGLGGTVTEPTTTSAENKLVINMPTAMLQIPQVNTEQIVSTTINFTAQGEGGTADTYDIEASNEMTIKYFAGPAA